MRLVKPLAQPAELDRLFRCTEQIATSELQKDARATWGERRPSIPGEIQCHSLRRHSFEREIPLLTGSSDSPPVRIPRLEDRGVCIIRAFDREERENAFAHAVANDLVDPSLGVLISASAEVVSVASPTGPVPECLATSMKPAAQIQRGCLALRENAAEQRPIGRTGEQRQIRAALITVLSWAIYYQRDLARPGALSLLVAEGHMIPRELRAFIQQWKAGRLDVATTVEPFGSADEQALMALADWGFDAQPFWPAPPDLHVDPDTGMTYRSHTRLVDVLENA